MCRLLAIKASQPISIIDHLKKFAQISKNSKEFQGHGWGLSFLNNKEWEVHKNINPIWESDLEVDVQSTIYLVHARSAFKDEGIEIENNMPFLSEPLSFIFNGELRGVKIKEEGRIGAEKIFNFIRKFADNPRKRDNVKVAISKGVSILNKRTDYIRAMNMIFSNGNDLFAYSQYNEDQDYFTLHKTINDEITIISSEPFGPYEWQAMITQHVEVV